MTEKTKLELMELIDRIADINRSIKKTGRDSGKLLEKAYLIRDRLVIEISQATNEKGKPLYSNEKLRESALRLKLAEHTEYQELWQRVNEIRDEENELAIEYNKLVDRKMILMAELGIPLQSADREQFPI